MYTAIMIILLIEQKMKKKRLLKMCYLFPALISSWIQATIISIKGIQCLNCLEEANFTKESEGWITFIRCIRVLTHF